MMTLRLFVEPEYSSSGIRQEGYGMVEHEELHLPPELSQRFDHWIQLYEAYLPSEHHPLAGRSGKLDPVPLEEFDAIGREAARELKAFMGPDVVVRYASALRNFGDPPELIE
jgi:hypothetical protein